MQLILQHELSMAATSDKGEGDLLVHYGLAPIAYPKPGNLHSLTLLMRRRLS
jgi:hypothetical protein